MDIKSLREEFVNKKVKWVNIVEKFNMHIVIFTNREYEDGHDNDEAYMSLIPIYIGDRVGARNFITSLSDDTKFGIAYTGVR